jgi:hypothetical protein
MKKLSIEEKAKAYDEALKYAMIYYKNGNEDMKTMMKTCFPVLVEESEDERIRKELIQFFKEKDEEDFEEWVPKAKILAWLEKQGEQKPTIEMKSAEESLGIDSETYNKIVDECICGEQKLTWSEEDEERLSDAIFFVREYQIPTRNKRLLNAAKEAEDWLKSLKQRIGG